jgi:hypothetical protein
MLLVTAALLGALTAIAGCCGSMVADPGKMDLPRTTKNMDKVHDRLVATGEKRLYAGAAVVDITTDLARGKGIFLGGFDSGRRNKGVRDPVYARALFLHDGYEPFVLVTIDTIGYMNDDVRDAVGLVTDRFQDRVVIGSTHNHVGPDTMGIWGCAFAGVLPVCSGRIPEYMEEVRHRIAHAVDLAAASAKPAKLRAGTAMAPRDLCLNIHDEIENVTDDLVRVLAFEDDDGKSIGVLANWGCHAESMWNDDQLSADWPGAFYKQWDREFGGVALFAPGALGGLAAPNPFAHKPDVERNPELSPGDLPVDDRVALRDHIGKALHQTVKAALAGSRAEGPGVRLHSLTRRIELPVLNWLYSYIGNRGLIRRTVRHEGTRQFLFTDVTALRILAGGRVVADLATIPGEPAPQLVQEIDRSSGAAVVLNIALGNDEIGYVLREDDWDLPYYEYERSMSLGKGTGTSIMGVIRDLRGELPGG